MFQEICDVKIKGISFERKNSSRNFKIKTILYVYREIFDFTGDSKEISVFVSKNFVSSVMDLLFCKTVIHHSHVSGNICGYAHDFCNRKVKKIYHHPISVFAHNLFKFDFFFVIKGLRLCVWKTNDLNIGGKGLRNISYVNISDQVKFIDTMKFYQESLHEIGTSMESIEQENIKKSLINFLESNRKFKFKYASLDFEDKKWVIEYLSGVRG